MHILGWRTVGNQCIGRKNAGSVFQYSVLLSGVWCDKAKQFHCGSVKAGIIWEVNLYCTVKKSWCINHKHIRAWIWAGEHWLQNPQTDSHRIILCILPVKQPQRGNSLYTNKPITLAHYSLGKFFVLLKKSWHSVTLPSQSGQNYLGILLVKGSTLTLDVVFKTQHDVSDDIKIMI